MLIEISVREDGDAFMDKNTKFSFNRWSEKMECYVINANVCDGCIFISIMSSGILCPVFRTHTSLHMCDFIHFNVCVCHWFIACALAILRKNVSHECHSPWIRYRLVLCPNQIIDWIIRWHIYSSSTFSPFDTAFVIHFFFFIGILHTIGIQLHDFNIMH